MPHFIVISTLLTVTYLVNNVHTTLVQSTMVNLQELTVPIPDTRDVIISFTETCNYVIEHVKNLPSTDRPSAVANGLKSCSESIQGPVLSFLNKLGIPSITPLPISNEIFIRNLATPIVELLLKTFSQIKGIRDQFMAQLAVITDPIPQVSFQLIPDNTKSQWGVQRVQAREAGYDGNGVVVATIDTGVRATHMALASNRRQTHFWFDASNITNPIPLDDMGHGTHTMGTIVGTQNGIGVAPGATWITCRACSWWCEENYFKICAEWILCPKNVSGVCSMQPDVVSNSWGGFPFIEAIEAWRAAGIIPVFALGNYGSDCATGASPGDYDTVIGVGATDLNDTIANFSSRGPSANGVKVKPDVVAPGVAIMSAFNGADNAYIENSGTSMSAPHVAGVVTILLSQNKDLTYDDVFTKLTHGCGTVVPPNKNCGNIPDNEYPNYSSGYGLVNARRSVDYPL